MRARVAITLLTISGLSLLLGWRLWACGPYLPSASFVAPDRPDSPPEAFRRGKLGILRPRLGEDNLIIAWRVLRGLGVPEPGVKQAQNLEEARDAWLKARNARFPGQPVASIDPYAHPRGDAFEVYNRYNPHAFLSATETLELRLRQHPEQLEAVRDWIKGQDMVFSSKEGETALPSPAVAPGWLRADRDYQRAACLFYCGRWEEARLAFHAIQVDADSPWSEWAGYLQARCWVREANLGPQERPPQLPPGAAALTSPPLEPYRRAEAQLRQLMAARLSPAVSKAVEDYLALVRHRTAPEALFQEAVADLVAPHPKAFWRSLETYHSARAAIFRLGAMPKVEPAFPPAAKPLQDWLEVVGQDLAPNRVQPSYLKARQYWDQGHPLEWLVAALMVCPGDTETGAMLLQEADGVAPSSPASRTLRWNSWRIRAIQAKPSTLPSILDSALKEPFPAWALNTLRLRRAALSTSMAEWARLLGLQPTEVDWIDPTIRPESLVLLDSATAERLNVSLTAAQLQDLASQPELASDLRGPMARAAWMRAVLTGEWDVANACLAGLEEPLRRKARKALSAQDPAERDFELVRLVLAHPGLSPFLAAGFDDGRGLVPPQEFNSMRLNWWCSASPRSSEAPLYGAGRVRPEPAPEPPCLLLLDSPERQKELWKLQAIPQAQVWFGRTVLEFAKSHPGDMRVPEALHRVVASTRSPRCMSPAVVEVSKNCFRLLHRAYKGSEWTRKTPYHY